VQIIPIDPQPGAYAQAVLVSGASRLLYIGAELPAASVVPADFTGQCRQAWAQVCAALSAAGMTTRQLLTVTVHLADARDRPVCDRLRDEVLGGHHPALTVLIGGTGERRLIMIEALAAA
jgi:2-iminobutanoate/2-iminopropanoate deaminase